MRGYMQLRGGCAHSSPVVTPAQFVEASRVDRMAAGQLHRRNPRTEEVELAHRAIGLVRLVELARMGFCGHRLAHRTFVTVHVILTFPDAADTTTLAMELPVQICGSFGVPHTAHFAVILAEQNATASEGRRDELGSVVLCIVNARE